MSKSSVVSFNRWSHVQNHTWPFQVYKLYNEELSQFLWAEESTSRYACNRLGKEGAKDTDPPTKFLSLPGNRRLNMKTVREWANVLDESHNWLRLNCVMAISSNLETYLGSVIALAIESNPGCLLGASKSIDGAKLLKNGSLNAGVYESHIIACTKGTWGSRLNAFERLFGTAPLSYRNGLSALERMRKLRNNLGHAFGRDIDAAKDFTFNQKKPADRIQLTTLIKYLELAYKIVQDIDEFLLNDHIGEFQAIYAYHQHRKEFTGAETDKALKLKQYYGSHDQQVGKVFCKGLVRYYEGL